MSTKGYIDFLTRMGHRIVRVGSTDWFNPSPRVFTPLPFHAVIDPVTTTWSHLFSQGCLIARCATPSPWGRLSYRLVIDDPKYGLDHLTSKSRNQTRRGLESCDVRPLTFENLITDGTHLERDTLLRQGRRIPRSHDAYWRRYFHAAAVTDGAIAWGAFHQKTLAAYLVAFEMDERFHILILRSATAQLRHYPNNALLFEFARIALRDGSVREVSIGFESLQNGIASLDHFKEGLGFRKLPVRQYVTLSPALRSTLRGPLLKASASVLDLFPRSETARKLSGMLRWYDAQRVGAAPGASLE